MCIKVFRVVYFIPFTHSNTATPTHSHPSILVVVYRHCCDRRIPGKTRAHFLAYNGAHTAWEVLELCNVSTLSHTLESSFSFYTYFFYFLHSKRRKKTLSNTLTSGKKGNVIFVIPIFFSHFKSSWTLINSSYVECGSGQNIKKFNNSFYNTP